MTHIWGKDGSPIRLRHSADDVAIAFAGADGPRAAKAALGAIHSAGQPARASSFDRVLLLHDTRAAESPVGTVVNALSPAHARKVNRTYPVYVEEQSGLRLVSTDQLVVRFKDKAPLARCRKLLAGMDLVIEERNSDRVRQFLVAPASLKSGSRALDLSNALVEADDLVEFAAPNFLAEVKKSRQAPVFPLQWHLDNRGLDGGKAGEDLRAVDAWRITGGGDPRIVIAILDDGVDLAHPALVDNIWRNPKRTAPDRHGRNFSGTGDPNDPRPSVFQAPFDNQSINDIHGTCCAGVAASFQKGALGCRGIAYRCKILPVKVFAGAMLAPQDHIADAIRYAARHADVISGSWSVARHPDIEAALADAVETGRDGRGCPVFFASGNNNARSIDFPSSDPNVYATGASSALGTRASYSNYGAGLDFLAPGGDREAHGITTTDLSRRNRGYTLDSAFTSLFAGTSAAAPLAAGVAALVLSTDRSLTRDEVGKILRGTADKIDGARAGYKRGYSTRYGYGRLNAFAAVSAARKKKPR